MNAECAKSVPCRLQSVAARYRHPYALGDRRFFAWRLFNRRRSRSFWLSKRKEEIRISPDNELARLEAVLFLSPCPQTSRKLAQLAGLADGTRARTLVRTLNQRFDAEGCAFRVEEVAGGYQLRARAKFAPWLRRLFTDAPGELRLSAPALETLAIIAYRQPVLRAEIESIRGVQCGEALRQLIERGLVKIVGRSPELGRPFLYGTTRLFMQVFGLRNLEELPRAESVRQRESLPAAQPAVDQNTSPPMISENEPI